MATPVEIVFRDMVPLPSLEGDIRRRADKLRQWAPDLIDCRVVVEAQANRHRTGHVYTVKIDVHLPGEEIFAGDHHANEEIGLAVRGAFDAIGRSLEDHECRRRGQVKQHAPKGAAAVGRAEPGNEGEDTTDPPSR
jgi:ribosome-associated translation inhibitor RaiA